jgi:hypothetical protein
LEICEGGEGVITGGLTSFEKSRSCHDNNIRKLESPFSSSTYISHALSSPRHTFSIAFIASRYLPEYQLSRRGQMNFNRRRF